MLNWIDPTIDVGSIVAFLVGMVAMFWRLTAWLRKNITDRIGLLEDVVFDTDAHGVRLNRLKLIEQDVLRIERALRDVQKSIDRRNGSLEPQS